jgi:vacuole morphology and inheritance protein 14
MNLTKAHLAEFDRLIQLLESPGFTSLRFELLERPPTLLATLHGVLMLLPQEKLQD